MPCYDHRDSEYAEEMRKQRNQLANWLCAVLTAIEDAQGGAPLKISDLELQHWWDAHKAWDNAMKEAKK